MNRYWVYILTSHKGVLYVGVTNDLTRRVYEHLNKLLEGFTRRYNVTRLVYYEETAGVREALEREKQIKGWLREKKLELIRSFNPTYRDLGGDVWGGR